MSWFDKLMPSRISTEKRKHSVPEGLWVKCEGCSAQLYRPELKRNLYVCPTCGHHLRIGARDRLAFFLDPQSGTELATTLEPRDPLKFKDTKRYRDRLSQAQKATGEQDALVLMAGTLKKKPIVAAAFEFRFMAGSMGSVVGERFSRGAFAAIERHCPYICFTASGGARMQEALYSLLQMAKTSAALAALAEAGLPYISVMTDPTTGGVSASLAFLGDINIAEPRSLIGFAGPRVIEQTVNETLPEGFQRAEFLIEKGAIDMIVDRRQMRDEVAALFGKLQDGRAAQLDCDQTLPANQRSLSADAAALGLAATAESDAETDEDAPREGATSPVEPDESAPDAEFAEASRSSRSGNGSDLAAGQNGQHSANGKQGAGHAGINHGRRLTDKVEGAEGSRPDQVSVGGSPLNGSRSAAASDDDDTETRPASGGGAKATTGPGAARPVRAGEEQTDAEDAIDVGGDQPHGDPGDDGLSGASDAADETDPDAACAPRTGTSSEKKGKRDTQGSSEPPQH